MAFEREAVLEFKREILDTFKSKFSNKIYLKPGGKYELIADVTHQFRSNDINGRIIAILKVDGVSDDYKFVYQAVLSFLYVSKILTNFFLQNLF